MYDGFNKNQRKKISSAVAEHEHEIICFASELIRCHSVTCEEGAMAKLVEAKMLELKFDEVQIDSMGNVIGRVGSGSHTILFDSHMDTVDVMDQDAWTVDPFGGEVIDGRLYGRGSVDMKGALAASVYAAAIAKDLGLLSDKCIYISASVMEEDYDGQAVLYLLEQDHLQPEAVVVCEATELAIGYGHRGRALIEITVQGKSAHGSRPELGVNPAYGLARIMDRIEKLASRLPGGPEGGSVAITGLSCVTASANSVPQSANITLDRRLSLKEDYAYIQQEMEELLSNEDASWQISDIPGISWRGKPVTLHSFLPAWEIKKESILVQSAVAACRNVMGGVPPCVKLGYSTNAVATAGLHAIPSIVLGPGSTAVAHMRDEYCPVDQLLMACQIYVNLCATYPGISVDELEK